MCSGLPKAPLLYQVCKALPQGQVAAFMLPTAHLPLLPSHGQMEHSKEQEQRNEANPPTIVGERVEATRFKVLHEKLGAQKCRYS